MRLRGLLCCLLTAGLIAVGVGCGDGDDDDGPSGTAAHCSANDDCYEDVDVTGDPICFTQVENGYCSHTCDSADDCCAAEGECSDDFDYVCTGLESRSGKFCFIECNADQGSGGVQSICDDAHAGLECRNTGRGPGSHVCLPPGSG